MLITQLKLGQFIFIKSRICIHIKSNLKIKLLWKSIHRVQFYVFNFVYEYLRL